jgi:hypothetical protein
MSITDALIHLLISVEEGKTAAFAENSSDRVIHAEWIPASRAGIAMADRGA